MVSLAAGGAAGALGYLAPIHQLMAELRPASDLPVATFYALPPFLIPLDTLAQSQTVSPVSFGRHLRAVVQLEVAPDSMAHVEALQPRIIDTLITFLHSLNERDIAAARGLDRLKAQMLYRVREVTGEEAVSGLLITELAVL
ncbi:MAG: flagellar basal body-associated FliL family protein [Geminicoccaceae bacterium]